MTEMDKLKHLLKHWIEHNEAHVKTYYEWAAKAEAMNRNDLSDVIGEIAAGSRKLDELFKKALDLI